jgi:hypothetical protein
MCPPNKVPRAIIVRAAHDDTWTLEIVRISYSLAIVERFRFPLDIPQDDRHTLLGIPHEGGAA